MKKALLILTAAMAVLLLIIIYNVLTVPGAQEATDNRQGDVSPEAFDTAILSQQWDEFVFPEDRVIDIYIHINDDDYNDLKKNAQRREYYPCDITYNGVELNNVAIRAKGNTSLTKVAKMGGERFSFRIDFNRYLDQNLYGLKSVNLNNIYKDPSYMRDKLTYEMCEYLELPTPKTAYANIYINGQLHGLYLVLQSVDDVFTAANFEIGDGDLYQTEMSNGSNLDYIDNDPASYSGLELINNIKESDGSKLIRMLQVLHSGENLEAVLDIERLLKYFAVCTAAVSLDSYQGGMFHNYFLYEEDGVFSFIPWDFNLSFGTYAIFGNNSIKRSENLSIDQPGNLTESVLLATLLAKEEYKDIYYGYLRQLIKGPMKEENLAARVAKLRLLIDQDVKNDPTAFYTYEEYNGAYYEEPVSVQAGAEIINQKEDRSDIPKLITFAVNRANSISLQLEGGLPQDQIYIPAQRGTVKNGARQNEDTITAYPVPADSLAEPSDYSQIFLAAILLIAGALCFWLIPRRLGQKRW